MDLGGLINFQKHKSLEGGAAFPQRPDIGTFSKAFFMASSRRLKVVAKVDDI
jgi:hypothetical protein